MFRCFGSRPVPPTDKRKTNSVNATDKQGQTSSPGPTASKLPGKQAQTAGVGQTAPKLPVPEKIDSAATAVFSWNHPDSPTSFQIPVHLQLTVSPPNGLEQPKAQAQAQAQAQVQRPLALTVVSCQAGVNIPPRPVSEDAPEVPAGKEDASAVPAGKEDAREVPAGKKAVSPEDVRLTISTCKVEIESAPSSPPRVRRMEDIESAVRSILAPDTPEQACCFWVRHAQLFCWDRSSESTSSLSGRWDEWLRIAVGKFGDGLH